MLIITFKTPDVKFRTNQATTIVMNIFFIHKNQKKNHQFKPLFLKPDLFCPEKLLHIVSTSKYILFPGIF